eukprot:TRINITY_DN14063_c0_g1_i4.p1 TRINITY_DN14063_c0_g1~~TRINITY_DN14063_c0_g1_i4.p1  ORF type:complete len:325 (-),score=89.15 TRINITY_DN14063_c0_g1_i4:201-1175(-)
MVRQDAEQSRPGAPEQDTQPNQTQGKSFVGKKGGGRYATVAPRDGEASLDGSIVCDIFDDGSFVYKYEADHEDMPDGEEVLDYFIESLFGSLQQNANKVEEIKGMLTQGGIYSMAELKSKKKRDLDNLGIPIGPRAKITGARKEWRPPKYNDESFIIRGRWQARDVGPVVHVRFVGEEEEYGAYDNVKMPCKIDFSLDTSFVPAGACRAMNGNMPGPAGLRRAFLTYVCDPREEEEVGWVKCKKETITNLCGDKLVDLARDANWLLTEYRVQSKELVESGGCYVDQQQVKRASDKFTLLKTTVDQCMAVFEDYYGIVPRQEPEQ